MLRDFFKYTTVRSPPERLLSGFMDKLSTPLSWTGLKHQRPFSRIQAAIVQKLRPLDFNKWRTHNGTTKLTVTFEEFVRWYVSVDRNHINFHFAPFLAIARPCTVRYDYYVRFNHYDNDSLELLSVVGGSPEMLWRVGLNARGAKSHMQEYYGKLSKSLKNELYEAIYDDLDFYHHLEPDDMSFNMELLDVRNYHS